MANNDAIIAAQAAMIKELEKKLADLTDPLIFPVAWQVHDALVMRHGARVGGEYVAYEGSVDLVLEFRDWLTICDPNRTKGRASYEAAKRKEMDDGA